MSASSSSNSNNNNNHNHNHNHNNNKIKLDKPDRALFTRVKSMRIPILALRYYNILFISVHRMMTITMHMVPIVNKHLHQKMQEIIQ